MSNDWTYFKFIELATEIRHYNGLKPETKNRLDCLLAYTPTHDYRGLRFFLNPKGMLYLNKTQARNISKVALQRQAVWMLTNKNINLSSIFVDVPEHPEYGYGNPPYSQMLGKNRNKPNPLFIYRNDLYLFVLKPDYSEVELIIIPEQKNLWNTYYFKLIQGELDEILQELRKKAVVFYDYGI